MTDQTAQEPTMEEILASIRRIISEDDAPAEAAAPEPQAASEPEAEPEAAPEPAPEPEPEAVAAPAVMDETPSEPQPPAAEDDVLELTDLYQAPAAESIGDLDVSAAEPEPFPTAFVAPEPTPVTNGPAQPYDSLVGESASASAASAFAGLAASFRQPEPTGSTGGAGQTVDELARSLLRPMLKDWLDANLPGIVEAQVRKEVERIARAAG